MLTRLGRNRDSYPTQPRRRKGGSIDWPDFATHWPLIPEHSCSETVGWTLKGHRPNGPPTALDPRRFSSHAPDSSLAPPTVRLAVDGTRLIAAGTAPWLDPESRSSPGSSRSRSL